MSSATIPTPLAQPRPNPTRPPFPFPLPPPGFLSEIQAKAGQRDLAIVFALITLAVPLFIVSIRYDPFLVFAVIFPRLMLCRRFHPRRRKEFAVHDKLVFAAMVR